MPAALLFIGLSFIYILTFLWNKKTEVPEECRDILITNEKCASCANTTCGAKPK